MTWRFGDLTPMSFDFVMVDFPWRFEAWSEAGKKHKAPEEGFLDLDERVVMALAGAGLTWGGTYKTAKDIMHFDLREGDGAKVNTARIKHTDNT